MCVCHYPAFNQFYIIIVYKFRASLLLMLSFIIPLLSNLRNTRLHILLITQVVYYEIYMILVTQAHIPKTITSISSEA